MGSQNKSTGAVPKKLPPLPGAKNALHSILKSKANPQYNVRRYWYELNMPDSTKEIFNGKSFSFPEKLLRHGPDIKLGKLRAKTRKHQSYTKMRENRENFRKKLVELIVSKDDAKEVGDDFPNNQEKELLRYYYYIKHGVDTIHVANLNEKVLGRIKQMIPRYLQRWLVTMEENINEIRTEYTFAMKQAIVDFVLSDSLKKCVVTEELSRERKQLEEIANRWRYRYDQNKTIIKKNLFSINRCVGQILDIWFTTYKNLYFVDVEQLATKKEAYDIYEFSNLTNKQIETAKTTIVENWYGDIHSILLRGNKKGYLPDVKRPKLLARFYNCVAALMTQQLEDLCIRSLRAFTNFVCDIYVCTENEI